MAELDAVSAADRLSWDDTAEGERLRRYELTCERMWLRMFDLLLKVRQKGGELDFATIAAIDRSVTPHKTDTIDNPVPAVASAVIPPEEPAREPDRPNEANSPPENAPNEANSDVQEISSRRRDGQKEVRIDTPHVDRKPGGIGITGKAKSHPALERVLRGGTSNLMNLSPIFGGQ